MKMERTTIIEEGTFQDLLSKAQNGDVIILYEGVWDSYRPCIQGVLVEKDGKCFLNDSADPFELQEEAEWLKKFFSSHPQGDVQERRNQLIFVVKR